MKGKSLVIAIVGMFMLAGMASIAADAKPNGNKRGKPETTGFDAYGYNYNARLFNGWYGHYDKNIEGGSIEGTGDAKLVMKWSQDWEPMADQPIGAWVTNHWTWYSNDYNEDTWYGWNTRVTWNETTEPEADYKITEFLKIQKVSNNEEAWEEYQEGGAYSAGWGTYDNGVPKYVVFQDTIEVYNTETGDMVASYNLCETAPKGLGQPIF